jgi:hypothetical protein
MKDAEPKRRGRPPTGATPSAERTTASRATLAQAGGRRLEIRLTSEGAENLDAIMARDGTSQTAAVHEALATAAKKRKR